MAKKLKQKGGIFTSVKKKRPPRSNFNLSHDVKMSLDMGRLCPIYLQECVPGDNIKIRSSQMMRMAPLISPVMHRIDVKTELFFVPNRILWDNWETFITGSRNGKQISPDDLPAFPTIKPWANSIDSNTFGNGNQSLMDYLGLPTNQGLESNTFLPTQTSVSALPFAAYQRVYDEYYRDQNLQESIYDDDSLTWDSYNKLTDGEQTAETRAALMRIKNRAWEHDYFTSALPWAQKGEEVTIPFEPYMAAGSNSEFTEAYANQSPDNVDNLDGLNLILKDRGSTDPDTRFKYRLAAEDGLEDKALQLDNTGSMQQAATINDLRAAYRLQEWLETNARSGTRYFESIHAHFGLDTPDSRLQRPEFIGSTRSNMNISEVLQTSSPQTETDTPQGNMSGHGQNVSSSPNMSYYCQEHGYIIGLMTVIPKTAYQDGIPRHWSKTEDRMQYYFPEFAHLGEQEIKQKELFAYLSVDDQEETFGYTPRYSEYKFENSRVVGDFRNTLRFWHLGRYWADSNNPPVLNSSFIESDPSERIFAVQDLPANEDESSWQITDYGTIYAHVFHDVKASRLMPKYGTPTL